MYKNLKEMLESNSAEMYGLEFTINVPAFESTPQYQDLIDLRRCPSSGAGDHTPVTNKNKELYISSIVEYRLKTMIAEQTRAFQEGVYDVIPLSLLQIFSPSELELLHCGLPHIDVDDLYKNTEYRDGYNVDCNCIKWFW